MAEDSASQVNDLEAVARSRFGELSEAEQRLMRATPKGEFAYCGPSKSDTDPTNDPAKADSWGPERWILANLVSWLCRDSEPGKMVHAKGLQVHAAKILGKLDLSFASVASPLLFYRCEFTDSADLMFLECVTEYVRERPVYLKLLAAPIRFSRDPAVRRALRVAIANAFRAKDPSLTNEKALLAANIALQMVRGMTTLYAEAGPEEKPLIIAEYKKALTLYLGSVLSREERHPVMRRGR